MSILDRLKPRNGVYRADGATGNALQALGYKQNAFRAPGLDETGRELLSTAAQLAAAANAQIITAGTWRNKPTDFAHAGVEDREDQRRNSCISYYESLKAAKEGASRVTSQFVVFASTSPVGDDREPWQIDDLDFLRFAHTENIELITLAGAEAINFETFGYFPEIQIVSTAAQAAQTQHIISLTVGPDGKLLDGTPLAKVVPAIQNKYLVAIGLNCNSVRDTEIALAELRQVYTGKILVKPNGPGQPGPKLGWDYGYDVNPKDLGKVPDNKESKSFADKVAGFVQAGADIVGGCCGTLAGHIRAINDAIDALPAFRAARAEVVKPAKLITPTEPAAFDIGGCACPDHRTSQRQRLVATAVLRPE